MDADLCDLLLCVSLEAAGKQQVLKEPPSWNTCSHCRNVDTVRLEDGNYACTVCHTVSARFLDASAEWHSYQDSNQRKDTTRCGLPVSDLLPQAAFGTIISYSGNDNADIKNIRKYQFWNSMSYHDRCLVKTFDVLTMHAINNGIPKTIIEQAKVFYKTISEQKISRGSNREGIIASSIYMACKQESVPRSAKEIAKIFNIPLSTMTRGCKNFNSMLDVGMDPTSPLDFVGRYCSNLGLDQAKAKVCKEFIKELLTRKNVLTHLAPPSIASGCILYCSERHTWKLTKKQVCRTCDISPATINKCSKMLDTFILDGKPT